MSLQLVRQTCLRLIVISALLIPVFTVNAEENPTTIPKNIIMVVADGMGPAYTTAYRYYADNDHSNGIDKTIFDSILVGFASTYPAQESGLVTDSAAGATALAAGVKTYNGAISVDINRNPVNTVLREAKRTGMRTGIAVTSQIVHATPAAFVTHHESRRAYNAIADQYYDDKINGKFIVDVMLGGGTQYFKREDRDITVEFLNAGYQYADSYTALADFSVGKNILGLFAPVGLPWSLDDKRSYHLTYLTEHAIKHLENDNGFFLLIEASQVDWAGHSNDISSAMAEMDDLAKTMEFITQYVNSHGDTLVVLTADHSTGGMTIGANGDYRWDPKWLKNIQSSVDHIAQMLPKQTDAVAYVEKQLGFALSSEEISIIENIKTEKEAMLRAASLKYLLDNRTNTGWTTSGHTGIDVPIYAKGPSSHLFAGGLDNTDIAKKVFTLLKKKSTPSEP